jgi:hypothetical protein
MKPTIAKYRDEITQRLIATERKRYEAGERDRACAYCGSRLTSGDKKGPRSGDHWFCSAEEPGTTSICRRRFYAGQFRRRQED